MPFKVLDQVGETSSNTPSPSAGTFTINLSGTGASQGGRTLRTFINASRYATGDTCPLHIFQTSDVTKWLTVIGTVTDATPDTITFTTASIIDGSSGPGADPVFGGTVTCQVEPIGAVEQNAERLGGSPIPGGRLTLESGVPVSTTDQTAKTTLYYTPYLNNHIRLFDGVRWKAYQFSELSIALGTLTSGLPYDVFCYDNAGTPTLELLAWTNGTTRATALTRQDGVLVKTGALTRLWVGTIYTASTTTTEDSQQKRFVYNAYNRVARSQYVDPGGSATTTSSTATEYSNAGALCKLENVCGDPNGQTFTLTLTASIQSSITNDVARVAQNVDTTTPGFTVSTFYDGALVANTAIRVAPAVVLKVATGYHYNTMTHARLSGTGTVTITTPKAYAEWVC